MTNWLRDKPRFSPDCHEIMFNEFWKKGNITRRVLLWLIITIYFKNKDQLYASVIAMVILWITVWGDSSSTSPNSILYDFFNNIGLNYISYCSESIKIWGKRWSKCFSDIYCVGPIICHQLSVARCRSWFVLLNEQQVVLRDNNRRITTWNVENWILYTDEEQRSVFSSIYTKIS